MTNLDMGALRHRIFELKKKESISLYPHIPLHDERENTLYWASKFIDYMEARVCAPYFDGFETQIYLHFQGVGKFRDKGNFVGIREDLIYYLEMAANDLRGWLAEDKGVMEFELQFHGLIRGIATYYDNP